MTEEGVEPKVIRLNTNPNIPYTVGELFETVAAGDFDKLVPMFNEDWKGFKEAINGFIYAVNWRDDLWIACWLFMVLSLSLASFARRKSLFFQSFLLGFSMFICALGEQLNKLGSEHWRFFSTQNYFDESGLFFTVIIAVPLILLSLFTIAMVLWTAADIVVEIKKMEFSASNSTSKKKNQ